MNRTVAQEIAYILFRMNYEPADLNLYERQILYLIDKFLPSGFNLDLSRSDQHKFTFVNKSYVLTVKATFQDFTVKIKTKEHITGDARKKALKKSRNYPPEFHRGLNTLTDGNFITAPTRIPKILSFHKQQR